MRKSLLTFVITIICCLLLAGCKGEAETAPSVKDEPHGEQQEKEEPEKSKKKSGDEKKKESLAKRLVGKYSFDVGDDDPENDRCLIMNVISFGDNVYAFCGEAMKDDGKLTEAYSYWAAEFLPFDADDMKSTHGDSVRVKELCFSNMSNAGKYWTSGWDGTIKLTDEGLLFEDFDKEGFLCSKDVEARLFVKDESVEDVFPYISGNDKGDDDLQGLWISEGRPPHVFLSVDESNITVFRKPYDAEARFARFGCKFDDGSFTGTGNVLGWGGMPYEINAKYKIDGDKLTMNVDCDDFMDEFTGKTVFMRADESDIPVITASDIKLDPESFSGFEEGDTVSSFESGEYYGVFVASFKTPDECIKTEQKLEEADYHLCPVVYTPDFSNLNPEPYYVVTAGLYGSQQDAEDALDDVKAAGFKDAYVKNTGKYIGGRYWYWLYGGEQIEILKDGVILHDVSVTIPYMVNDESVKMNLFIGEDTVFDKSAELQFFGNYEDGQTPYEWIVKNYNLMSEDPDKYMESGPALSGIFEVSLDGDHVKKYFGSYWWD